MKQIIKKHWKRITFLFFGLAISYLFLLTFPSVFFAYKIEYKQCTVYSDKPIDDNITVIIDDAIGRISKSELYDSTIHFNFFICNDIWRLSLFTQGNTNAGAVTQYDFTRNIFFRPCDIVENKIIPAESWYFKNDSLAFIDRPLIYYFAHEMTHVLQSQYTGRGHWRYPTWLTEGYADYIAKDGEFDFNKNLTLWHDKAPELDPTKGLYRLYHLKIAYLLDRQNKTIKEIYEHTPTDKILTEVLWAIRHN
ncbi:MAG: hypothetical protein R2787_00055 [Saprospiraceae bacterium]